MKSETHPITSQSNAKEEPIPLSAGGKIPGLDGGSVRVDDGGIRQDEGQLGAHDAEAERGPSDEGHWTAEEPDKDSEIQAQIVRRIRQDLPYPQGTEIGQIRVLYVPKAK